MGRCVNLAGFPPSNANVGCQASWVMEEVAGKVLFRRLPVFEVLSI
jgi:hypothetical protein